ncbi:MAG: hypothetical protein ACJAS9_003381 [Polaribacter sp.]
MEDLDCDNPFVINPIIYAECTVAYETIEEVEALIKAPDLEVKPIPREALFLSGKAFVNYSRKKKYKN